jgi:hypothetical protein
MGLKKNEAPHNKVFKTENDIRGRLKGIPSSAEQKKVDDLEEIWSLQNTGKAVNQERTRSLFRVKKISSFLKKITIPTGFYKAFIHKRKAKKVILIPFALLLLITFVVLAYSNKSNEENRRTILGTNDTNQTSSSGSDDGRTEGPPSFAVLYPKNKENLVAVTRKTPSGDIIHTFKDEISSIEIEVTQQELPASFKEDKVTKLENMAKGFLADNIIQVDTITIYHGMDERTGVQSLFFIKNESLFSVRAASQLNDDIWAAYIASLQ